MIGFLNFEVAAVGKIVLRRDVMEMKWSEWLPFGEVALGGLPEKEGIYQFRCVDEKGTPIMISRLKGKDSNGIIYIGSSENLKNRIKGFWKTIENWDRSRHAAAWTYCTFKYDSLFPPHNLQFRYIATKSTTRYEFDLLLGYRKKFMDLPPLNSNRPPYPYDWKARIRKVFGMEPIE